MALRNQPYLPLYVDDFANDEKLKECSASSIGVYVYVMCVMHKSEPYGKILLKQKYKTDSDTIKCFASQLTKQMPFDFHTVTKSLAELLHEKVLVIESDMLIQKRMVKDNELSEIRAQAGKNGGDKTKKHFAKAKSKAKQQAKPVIGVGIDNGLELVYPFESIEFKDNWREWVDYRKNEKKEPYATIKSEQRALMA